MEESYYYDFNDFYNFIFYSNGLILVLDKEFKSLQEINIKCNIKYDIIKIYDKYIIQSAFKTLFLNVYESNKLVSSNKIKLEERISGFILHQSKLFVLTENGYIYTFDPLTQKSTEQIIT